MFSQLQTKTYYNSTAMNIILLDHIEKVGAKHEVVSVKAGYGRNYLIPNLRKRQYFLRRSPIFGLLRNFTSSLVAAILY